MSAVQGGPGGLSLTDFRIMALDASGWLWGTVQGAFNTKASLSQIIVDAVIGMIPLVGDVTAVRDLIAVSIRLVDDPKARDDKWEWVLLVVLLFALIPVFGGVVKGVGRIVIKVAGEAAHLAGAARAAHLAQGARDIIAFLNRIGHGHAEKWLLSLNFSQHQAALMGKFNDFVATINKALDSIKAKLGDVLPQSLINRIDGLKAGFGRLSEKAQDMIPAAIKELDQTLREIQAYVRSGGETTSRLATHSVSTGEKVVTRADEARLIESGPLPAYSRRGGLVQNEARAKQLKKISAVYEDMEPHGYPSLFKLGQERGVYTKISAYSGKIVNRPLKEGEQVFRVFGPARTTHGVPVGESYASGAFWGVGQPPKNAKEWRQRAAVKDEWNGDGFIVTATVPPKANIKACVGAISEQAGERLPGQYLPGGGVQAVFFLEKQFAGELSAAGQRVISTGKVETLVHPVTGMQFRIQPTGWKDANGIHGYAQMPGAGYVQALKLEAREAAVKDERGHVR
jgi:hypothetical protein